MITEGTVNHLLNIARDMATKSQDPSTKVGGVLLSRAGISYYGWNRFVGIEDPETATREERYEDVVHAEEVAMMKAGMRATGGLYVGTHEPCGKCWRRLILAGVETVAFLRTDPERRTRWGSDKGRALAEERGIKIIELGA